MAPPRGRAHGCPIAIAGPPHLPAVLCHVSEKVHVLLAQLDVDGNDAGPGATGDHRLQPGLPQLGYAHG